MTEKDFDAILQGLYDRRKRSAEAKQTVLRAELDSISRQMDAYYDGLYDATKKIQECLAQEEKETEK